MLVSDAPVVITCFIPWVGTPLVCLRRTPPLSAAFTQKHGLMKTSRPCANNLSPWDWQSIGRVNSQHVTHPITAMNRRCLLILWRRASLIVVFLWSIGIPLIKLCWPMSKLSTARVGALAPPLKSANLLNGS